MKTDAFSVISLYLGLSFVGYVGRLVYFLCTRDIF